MNNKIKTEVKENLNEYIEKLKQIVKIPSISFDNFDQNEVLNSAREIKKLLNELGATNIQLLVPPSGRPTVYGELLTSQKNPTVLLYAHHDVQPPMRVELWESNPFEPEQRGERLYGRGTADDKAGIIIHLTAAKLARKYFGDKAPNLKFIFEGEEESGSAGFAYLLEKYRDLLKNDAVIVADLGNFAKGIPSITTTLRGMSAVGIEIKSGRLPLHSGSWSGPIPDPAQELCRLIAGLTDGNGNILIEGFNDGLVPPTAAEKESYKSLNYTEQKFREEAALLNTTELLVPGSEICESLWRRPSITVTAMEAGDRKQAGNVLQESAYARIGIRLAPGMNSKLATQKLVEHLKKNVAHGLTLTIHEEDGAEPFTTDTDHPFFKAMTSAMENAFETETKFIGCGASIPGAEYFRKTFGDIPILLIGVEDPECNAHGENESLYIPDFEKSIVAETIFFGSI